MEPLLPEAASKEAEQLSWGGRALAQPPPASNTRPWRGSYFLLLIPVPLLETRATVESWRAAAGRDHSSLDGGDNHHGQPDQDHHLHRAKFVLPINLYQLKNKQVVESVLCCSWVTGMELGVNVFR